MVELGSGSFKRRNNHQKLFLRAICQFLGTKHASSRHSLQIECWFLHSGSPINHTNRKNTSFPGRKAVSLEINAKYLFLRQMSDLGSISAAKHVFTRHTLQIECRFLDSSPSMDCKDRMNTIFPVREGISEEITANYLIFADVSDLDISDAHREYL